MASENGSSFGGDIGKLRKAVKLSLVLLEKYIPLNLVPETYRMACFAAQMFVKMDSLDVGPIKKPLWLNLVLSPGLAIAVSLPLISYVLIEMLAVCYS